MESGETQIPFLLPKDKESDTMDVAIKRLKFFINNRTGIWWRAQKKTDILFTGGYDGSYNDTDRIIFYHYLPGQ